MINLIRARFAAPLVAVLACGCAPVLVDDYDDEDFEAPPGFPGDGQVLADGLGEVDHLAVGGGFVYFTETDTGRVLRVPAGGGPVETVAAGALEAGQIAADAEAVFWLEGFAEGRIRRAPLAGGPAASVVVAIPLSRALALDPGAGGNVYWVEGDPGALRVRMASKAGSGAATTLAPSSAVVSGLATDGAFVWFADGGNRVRRVEVATGIVSDVATAREDPVAIALSPDGASVVWTELANLFVEGRLALAPAAGGAPAVLAAGGEIVAFQPDALAVSGGSAYGFGYDGDPEVVRAPLAGGPATRRARLADGAWPSAIAADGSSVYWTESAWNGDRWAASVRRIAK